MSERTERLTRLYERFSYTQQADQVYEAALIEYPGADGDPWFEQTTLCVKRVIEGFIDACSLFEKIELSEDDAELLYGLVYDDLFEGQAAE